MLRLEGCDESVVIFKSETLIWQKRRLSPRNAAKSMYRLEALSMSAGKDAAAARLLISLLTQVYGIQRVYLFTESTEKLVKDRCYCDPAFAWHIEDPECERMRIVRILK